MNMLIKKGHLRYHLQLKDQSSNIQFSTCQEYQNYADITNKSCSTTGDLIKTTSLN